MTDAEFRRADPQLVYRVAQLFIEERNRTGAAARGANWNLADYVTEKIHKEFPDARFRRQSVWAMAGEAVRRGFLVLVPPFDVQMQDAMAQRYPHLAARIHVVHTASHLDNKKVSVAAAKIALERSRKIATKLNGGALGLGLGPGRATRDFCESFGRLIAADRDTPNLDLFAISAGCPAREPEYASISFFNLFDDQIVHERTGLFAETLVYVRDFAQIQKRAGVKEAFKARDRIHMVVTSMGDMNDEHDLLRLFLEDSGVDVSTLCKRGWIGNVQYRPYTMDGPVKENDRDLRAVTLFELNDLANMAGRDDKAVILIARQCGKCKRTRAKALEPLLIENSKLRVFSDLVMDTETCRELLTGKPKSA